MAVEAAGSTIARRLAVPAVVISACFLYLALFAFRGWVPHDEGLLGQTADRVGRGEIPHVDFDDPYTGLLGYMHASAFLMFGERLSSLRIFLLVVAGLMLPLFWNLASMSRGSVAAAFITVLMVAWTLPNYFAALPSWFNLFLAILGTSALLRFTSSRHWSWLFVAGVCGGVSILIKISGLYFVAAAMIFLVVEEEESAGKPAQSKAVAVGVTAVATAFLFFVLRSALTLNVFLNLALPPLLTCTLLFRSPIARVPVMARRLSFFGVGVAIPILIFAARYTSPGALHSLIQGVFVLPQQRLMFAASPPPPVWMLFFSVPVLLLFLWPPANRAVLIAIAAILAGAVVMGGWTPMYRIIWSTARASTLVLSATVVLRWGKGRTDRALLAFTLVAVWCSLVQFPYSRAIYFCYVAPLVFLAVARLAHFDLALQRAAAVLGCFYLAFALLWMNGADVMTAGSTFEHRQATSLLLPERANLLVSDLHRGAYERIVHLVREHSGPSPYIYAAPDCPEIYFLSAKLNPTRTLYDFVQPATRSPAELHELVTRTGIRVVVVNTRPEFSRPLDGAFWTYMVRQFPNGEQIGPYIVLWKNRTP